MSTGRPTRTISVGSATSDDAWAATIIWATDTIVLPTWYSQLHADVSETHVKKVPNVQTCPDRHVFKTGDRVMVTRTSADNKQVKKGMLGTVMQTRPYHSFIGVRFDEHIGGHAGMEHGMRCKDGHGWYTNVLSIRYLGRRVNPDTVELLAQPRKKPRRRCKRKGAGMQIL